MFTLSLTHTLYGILLPHLRFNADSPIMQITVRLTVRDEVQYRLHCSEDVIFHEFPGLFGIIAVYGLYDHCMLL